jgi:DNA-binding NarL/FixJ family response regulator
VLQLIAEGHSNKRIASTLSLSVKTIETHRGAVHRNLKIQSTAGLVWYAIRNKMIDALLLRNYWKQRHRTTHGPARLA